MISIRFLAGRLDILERIPLVLWAFMGVSVLPSGIQRGRAISGYGVPQDRIGRIRAMHKLAHVPICSPGISSINVSSAKRSSEPLDDRVDLRRTTIYNDPSSGQAPGTAF